ncbi:MAG: UDP-N-acetylmuramoyl-tripeptide--D-alanyl-D-alanine ligase [Candidatus Pacebacteria bacterium]|nr:UDP-N-acetylmuramoyl-tripeptide--D-alanyl-D-alanine ligase [Candidatus Paceibacterota bacterium]
MSIILIAIFILFLIKLLRDSLYFVWFWQVKEYRIDRMISHLKENDKIFQNNLLYISAVIIFILYLISLKNVPLFFQYLVLIIFLFSFLQIVKEIKNRNLKRPKPTLKVILIFLLLAIVYSMIAFCWISSFVALKEAKLPIGSLASVAELLLFVYIVNSLVISSIVLAINPLFIFQKRRLIKRATLKMAGLKKIKVIGITGSYGKTSTKEFLYTILSQKYKVVRTEGNNNTNIGVAYTVLNKVNDDYDYFICEMGAYKIGEIAEICSIVQPEIGILTGINEQHLELFGSIENTIKAKFELIKSLPENGMGILNGDNEYIKTEIGNWSKGFSPTIKLFQTKDIAPNIKVYQDCVEFVYRDQKFKLNLLGKHYIENVLSAIMVAEHLGMNLEEIKNATEKIKPTEYMMGKLVGPNDSVFIDDSYSANPDGVIAALDYLNEAYSGYKKIIVFPGIMDLGKESRDIHKKLFDRIGEVCNIAYILNQDTKRLHSPIGTMEPASDCEFIFEKDFDKVTKMIKNNLDKNTVVLLESRGAEVVMIKLKRINNDQ